MREIIPASWYDLKNEIRVLMGNDMHFYLQMKWRMQPGEKSETATLYSEQWPHYFRFACASQIEDKNFFLNQKIYEIPPLLINLCRMDRYVCKARLLKNIIEILSFPWRILLFFCWTMLLNLFLDYLVERVAISVNQNPFIQKAIFFLVCQIMNLINITVHM